MADMNNQNVKAKLVSVLPTLLILFFVIAYLITAYQTLNQDSRHLPVLSAYLVALLLAADLFFSLSGNKQNSDSRKDTGEVPLFAEVKGISSLIVLVAGVYLFGFYLAGPVYMVLAIWWLGQQPLRTAIITSLSTMTAIYLIFEKALSFRLFTGSLFS